MMFGETVFLERFVAARQAGFKAVEFLFPYGHSEAEISSEIKHNGLAVSVFNFPPGDWDGGERGLAALPGRQEEFKASVSKAVDYAVSCGAGQLHAMAGICGGSSASDCRQVYLSNIEHAAQQLELAGLNLLIEPINSRDMPGYFLSSTDFAEEIIREISAPNLRLQFDVYHHQIMRGDVSSSLQRLMPIIGHIQIAGVPDRHEPDEGELNYAHIFRKISELGYEGWIGCEYRPREGTLDNLGWIDNIARSTTSQDAP